MLMIKQFKFAKRPSCHKRVQSSLNLKSLSCRPKEYIYKKTHVQKSAPILFSPSSRHFSTNSHSQWGRGKSFLVNRNDQMSPDSFQKHTKLLNHTRPLQKVGFCSTSQWEQDKEIVSKWEPRVRQQTLLDHDRISFSHIQGLEATLNAKKLEPYYDRKWVPPGWHLIFFSPKTREENLSGDGYESTWCPPPPFNQRMWAGSVIKYNWKNPLIFEKEYEQKTYCPQVELKQGRNGNNMILVTEQRDISNDAGLCVSEKRQLVYMKQRPPSKKILEPPSGGTISKTTLPTSVLLFRYSALTFNSHKIHYDFDYARDTEKYPGVLVHGPLTATLCFELIRENLPPTQFISEFSYKATSPLFVVSGQNSPVKICGKPENNPGEWAVWAESAQGSEAMKGIIKTVEL